MSSDDPIVRLNVGGKHFDARRSTLIRMPFFARMLGGSMREPDLDKDDRIYVEYEPDGFSKVLCYLRTNACVQQNVPYLEKHAFDYFGVDHPGAESLKRKREATGPSVRALTGYTGSVLSSLKKQIAEWKPEEAFAKIWVKVPSASESDWSARVSRSRYGGSDDKIAHVDLLECLMEDLGLDGAFEVLDSNIYFGVPHVGSIKIVFEVRRK